jgi:hypothetical protein
MTYGQFLKRRDMAMGMSITGQTGKSVDKIDIDLIQEAVTRFEFGICIANHNLEDENDRKLSLSEPADFNRLDPKIGQEISELIDNMNQWADPKSPSPIPAGSGSGDTVPEDSSTLNAGAGDD